MDNAEETVTKLEDARVRRVTHCCQFLPSCRVRVLFQVTRARTHAHTHTHTHTHTQRMKVV